MSTEVHVNLDRADVCRSCGSVNIRCINHQNLSAVAKFYLTQYRVHDKYSPTQWYFMHLYLIRIYCPASQSCTKVFINLFFGGTRNFSIILYKHGVTNNQVVNLFFIETHRLVAKAAGGYIKTSILCVNLVFTQISQLFST